MEWAPTILLKSDCTSIFLQKGHSLTFRSCLSAVIKVAILRAKKRVNIDGGKMSKCQANDLTITLKIPALIIQMELRVRY
jgi:hypothetical protein